ncbi:Cas10/Cmr2 second palm domain-containing protein [Metasolibacillus meyeri]|uniref:Cas10/Cmr2 second palm domain-containing protein n=1 Tax=Metasolibacillus meyeri TaxID=1071052 RepID=UPI000D3054FD|nr:hypothetical protein [Metasolibacillus meyeri]
MRNDYLLAIYDITGIQEYIFASNRLQENMGASFIVGNMVKEYFTEIANRHEILTEWHRDDVAREFTLFANSTAKGEVIYIGGGNALVVYRDWAVYNEVNKEFALKVLEESASLTMVTEAISFSEEADSYEKIYSNLMEKLSETKSKIVRTKLNQTLPVFAQEPFKGEPITKKYPVAEDKVEYLSTEQWLKRQASQEDFFKDISNKFARETPHMKRQVGEDSYTAVVHIDGNGMGEWLKGNLRDSSEKSLKENLQGAQKIKAGIEQHRASSLKITSYFRTIFSQTVQDVMHGKDNIPLRPLILDGDDITFICQADWGIEFTQKFLENLDVQGKEDHIYACAGIALVHSHFPFQLAYDIAEQCCQRAKKRYYNNEKSGSYLDFYIVRGSYVQTMDEQLAALGDLGGEAYTTDEMEKLLNVSKCLTANWPRSRLIQLYEAYLSGEEAVELVKDEAASRGYSLEKVEDTILFNALRLLEFVQKEGGSKCDSMSFSSH